MKRITIQKKGFLYRMDIEKDNLAINEKYNLTIKEAVKYFNIGEKNLRRLVSDNPNAAYILTIEKTKTEAGTRVLPMSDEVYAAFKRVVQNRKKPKVEEMIDGYTGFLFLDKRGKPMMPYQWEKRFQHVVEKYNRIYRVQLPKITPHVCRHTFCTNAAKRGISVETLKYLMGHTDISVTSNVYTHLKLEDAQREMERLERVEKEMKKCAK